MCYLNLSFIAVTYVLFISQKITTCSISLNDLDGQNMGLGCVRLKMSLQCICNRSAMYESFRLEKTFKIIESNR